MGKTKIRGRKSKLRNAQTSAQELAKKHPAPCSMRRSKRRSGDRSPHRHRADHPRPRASGTKVLGSTKPWSVRNAHEHSAAQLNSLGQRLLTDIREVPAGRRFATSLAGSIVKSLVAKGMVKNQTLRLSQSDTHHMPAPALLRAA